jgi:3-oxo-5alpha-steroid 4-dehydrogenase
MTTSGDGKISPSDAPIVVNGEQELRWTCDADVVVVGFGGAGATAALQAAESGASVVVVERFGGGGSTWWSGGVIYAAGTRYQKEAGVEDNAEEAFKYLSIEYQGAVAPTTLRRFAEQSAANVDWLAKHGVPFGSKLYSDKTIYPPDGYYLYYSGNEKVPGYREHAKPAPRGHRPVSPGSSGQMLFDSLAASVRSNPNIRVLTHSPATRLVLDRTGNVLGIEINPLPDEMHGRHQEIKEAVGPLMPFISAKAEATVAEAEALESRSTMRQLVRARGGVILTTGGFIYNLAMFKYHRPEVAKHYETITRLATIGDDGSGIKLGLSAGGATSHMRELNIGMSIAPPDSLLHGILVNKNGERFINEDAYVSFVGNAVVSQPESQGWLILDSTAFWAGFRVAAHQALGFQGKMARYFGAATLGNMFMGGSHRAGSMRALARKCGIDADRLEATVAAYNRDVSSATGDPLHKSRDYARPIGRGSYYALNLSLTNKYVFTQVFTLGGLVTDDETGAVLRSDGAPIRGLYAAGRVAAGLNATRNLSGLSIGDCVFSGRRAAGACTASLQLPSAKSA